MFKNLLAICGAIICCVSITYGQTLTTTRVSVDDVANPLIGGNTGRVILGISVDKTAGAVDFTNLVVNTGATNPNTVFSSVELWTSATNFGAATNTNATVTLNASNITFAGNPTNLFSYGAGVVTGRTFYVVATVRTDVTSAPTIALALTEANTTYSGAPTETAFSITGSTYNFLALEADFTQNAADATALADQNGVELLDFTVNSNGTQTISPNLVFTFNTNVTSILENWDLRVGGVGIPPGTEIYTLNGAGTQLTVSAFTGVDVTNATNFQLFADIQAGASSSNDFTISLVPGGVTIAPGIAEAFGTFSNAVNVTGLEADFTQNAADATALADQNGVELLDFTVNSNGTQTISPNLVFTFNTNVTSILENWDLLVGGLDIPGTEIYTLNGAGTQLTISGFTGVDVTNATNFQLFADIQAGASSSNDFTISLVPGGVTIAPGIAEAFGTFSNAVNVTGLEADFTQNAADATALADQNGVELLDFTANSNGTQTISPNLVFTFNTNVTSILENWDLRVGGSDIPGTEIYTLNGGGNQLTISGFTGVDVTSATNFQLYADIQAGATTLNDFAISLAPGGVNIAPGTPEAFGTFSNTIDIVTSQASDITFTSGSGVSLNYRNRQATSINDSDLNNSFRLGTFQLRDGGAGTDADNKVTSITSITMQITNPANIRQIALFEDEASVSGDNEIPGTEQTMPGSGTVVFTPSTPIRTLTDGGTWDFMVRVTFNASVTDNQAMVITITSVTGETNYSGFAAGDAGGANSTSGANHTILVVATKFRFNPAVTSTSPLATNFGPVTIMAVDGNPPLSNRDFDYNGKIDLTLTSGPGTLTGGGQKTLASGQVTVPTLSISLAGSHELTVSDEEYNDAPDNQPSIEDVTATITITSAASGITQGTTTPATICFGNTVAGAIPTAYFPLSNIVIAEADPAGVSGSNGSYSFSIALPAGFVFDPTVASGVTLSAGPTPDLTGASGYTYLSSNTVVQFSFTLNGISNTNTITIGGLKVGYTHPGTVAPAPTGTLNITRSGGTATIAGAGVGIVLGTVSANQNNPAVDFTVTATVGNIDPNTTSYNVSSPPVNLIGEPTVTPVGVFSGSGVTPPPPNYRFNPNTLAQGNYDITYLQTSATGCQSVAIKTFTVFDSGIGGLASSYCNNAAPSSTFTVSGTFINNIFGAGWSLSHYTYYDPNVYHFNLPSGVNATVGATYINNGQTFTVVQTIIATSQERILLCSGTGPPLGGLSSLVISTGGGDALINYSGYYNGDFRPITSPANNQFNPALPAYQTIYNYFGQQIPIGFAVCNNTTAYPCNGTSNYGTYSTYQWVTVNPAPNVNFTLPSDIYAYCEDNAPVTLIGSPPNSTAFLIDKFTAGSQAASISHALVGPDEVWSFSPGAVTGVTASTSVQVDITYEYKDLATNCINTITKPIMVHDRPGAVPGSDISKVQPGALPPSSTTIQLCQGSTSSFSFTASNPSGTSPFLSYSYTWYENSVSPANLKGTTPTFNPSVNTATPGPNTFVVTRQRNGCESTALPLSVVVVGSPPAPIPNFTDGNRQYCVGGTLTATHLGVPGTSLKWYDAVGEITPIADPNQPTEAELSISLASDNVYSYNVTQTELVNNCEGPPTPLTVTVKALPVVSVTEFPGFDATKICTTKGDVRFVATDLSDPGNPAADGTWSGTGLAGSLNDFPSLGEVELDPSSRLPGTYTLEYLYENSANCSSTGSISVTILPTITPVASVGDVCNGSPAILNNTSSINNGSGQTSTIASAEWTFGDGVSVASGLYTTNIDPIAYPNTAGTYQNPQHIYPNTGTFQIFGILTTSDGCPYAIPSTSTIPVTISALPVAGFISENVCVGSQTDFTATTSIPVQTYDWNFSTEGVLNSGTSTGATTNTANFIYTSLGKDSVELIVTTTAGCQDIVKKPIYSVPNYTPITSNDSYVQGFAATSGGWLTGGSNSSWQLVVPVEAPTPLTGLAWDTRNNQNDENSWVMSGCFDFSGATKPVISLNIWSDVPTGVDGAVLQYNLTGNIEDNVPNNPDPDGDWIVVGEVDSGINWYDENGISNNPGSQTAVSTGWSGKYAQWKNAIYKLDDVSGESKVVFRVAFASSIPRGTGFTFDSVFVGERSRVVLLENFTNSSIAPTTHNTNNYATFKNASLGQELVKVQYHTAFPGDDPVNDLNQQMNNARAAFYGITESPTIRLDGEYRNGTIGGPGGWIDDLYDDRVLTPSALRLDATIATKVGADVEIDISVENTTSQNLPLDGLHIFTVVVEKIVNDPILLSTSGNAQFVFVAKQMLPSPAGFKIPTGTIVGAGQTYTPPTVIWEGLNDGDAIVVYVQSIEGNNKIVHQAFLLNNPPTPDVVTGVEDPLYGEKINLFPNPANHEVNIELPAVVTRSTPVLMFDTYGRTVYENSFAPGEETKKVNTAELAGGVYIIQINTPEGNLARRKVMITHR